MKKEERLRALIISLLFGCSCIHPFNVGNVYPPMCHSFFFFFFFYVLLNCGMAGCLVKRGIVTFMFCSVDILVRLSCCEFVRAARLLLFKMLHTSFLYFLSYPYYRFLTPLPKKIVFEACVQKLSHNSFFPQVCASVIASFLLFSSTFSKPFSTQRIHYI